MSGRSKQRGMTFLELTIALGLIGFLVAAVLGFYMTGLKMWSGNDSRSHLLQEVQVANRSLRASAAESNVAGVSVSADGKIVALISPRDLNGATDLSDAGIRRWQSWQVYYQDGTTLRRAQVEWTGATPAEREVPDTLENVTGLTLESVAANGRMLAQNLYGVSFSFPGTGLVRANWDFRRWSKAKPEGERLAVDSAHRVRN